MKYKINQSRLYTLASQFILSELGEMVHDERIPTLEIFVKNGYETAMMNYSPKINGYQFNIENRIYEMTKNMFMLNDNEMRKILGKLIYDLTGVEVVTFETFE